MTLAHLTDTLPIDKNLLSGEGLFRHTLLIAMPQLQDNFFHQSVIYMCAHNASGAMGIIINQRMPDLRFGELLTQLKLPESQLRMDPVIHFGGPIDTGRGFVLHSADYKQPETMALHDTLSMTGTLGILKALAEDKGPRNSLFALGYAGWDAGQLEAEIQANSWLTVPSDNDILFHTALDRKWQRALSRLGIEPFMLSSVAGHA